MSTDHGQGGEAEPVGDKNGGGGGEVYEAPTAHLCPRREGGRAARAQNGGQESSHGGHGSVADVSIVAGFSAGETGSGGSPSFVGFQGRLIARRTSIISHLDFHHRW